MDLHHPDAHYERYKCLLAGNFYNQTANQAQGNLLPSSSLSYAQLLERRNEMEQRKKAEPNKRTQFPSVYQTYT
jgi:hypothetical protein